MNYLESMDWEKLKKDIGTGLEKGAVAFKKGALVVKKKAGELTEEGKRQYKIMTLKSRVHSQMADLGARVYAVMGSRSKNPATDATVKDLVLQIRKNEMKVASLMRMSSATSRKKAS